MEKLLQQIRDNQRFQNWCCFPGNSIEYVYNPNESGEVSLITYKRDGKIQFQIEKIYDDWGFVIEERYKTTVDGTDNI